MLQLNRRTVCAVLLLAPMTLGTPPSAVLHAGQTVPTPVPDRRPLTLDDIYDPQTAVEFDGKAPSGLIWMTASDYLWPKELPKIGGRSPGSEWLKVDAASGKSAPMFDTSKMESALGKLPGVSSEEAKRLAHLGSYTMNQAFTATVLTIAEDLYYYEFDSSRAVRLTYTPGEEEEVTFSPDGRLVAFVRDSNISLVDLATGREHPVTTDGTPQLLNGKLDWVYQEEIYGRGTYRSYWWSPDSSRIAFLQLNESPVPEFTVVDHIPYRQAVEISDYPKAGDPNPTVKLGVVRVAGGPVRWVDTDKYTALEFLIVGVDWSASGEAVVYQVQNREQTWLDLNVGDPGSGVTRTLFRETSKAWVNAKDGDNPIWLKDDSFLWTSERSGWKHLYRYKSDGTLIGQITEGRWEVRALHGIDQANGWIYFSGTERSPIGRDVYRVKLDGSGLARLSAAEGTHRALFNPTLTSYLDTWSNATTPPQVRLHRADGSEVRVIDGNKVPALAEYRLARPEFLQVPTRDGFVMEAMMIKPPDFDRARRYPVYQFTYGGPHAQQVLNAWGGKNYMYHQLLAQNGVIVWMCDNRTASGKGMESTWPVYRNFGELELRDMEDGLSWLKQQPYVDGSRIGVHGWSYGGFMTSYALTHSTSFVMGIAGGTVSDWRDYDSIYTERYMSMPQNNPEGYRKSSPRFAATDLHGALLLIHGTIDDNVHVQNTLQFAYELQKAGKPFELMLYPKSRHGLSDPVLVKHLHETMLTFVMTNLVQAGPKPAMTHAR